MRQNKKGLCYPDVLESILGSDVRTRRQICESSEEDLMDAYRGLIRVAKSGASFEDLIEAIGEFIEAFHDMDDDGERIDSMFGSMLRTQILSDDLQAQVSAAVQESLKKPNLDARALTEGLEEMEATVEKTAKAVNIARSFQEAAAAVESFLGILRSISDTKAACVEEELIQGVLGVMKSAEFTKSVKAMVKALAKEQG